MPDFILGQAAAPRTAAAPSASSAARPGDVSLAAMVFVHGGLSLGGAASNAGRSADFGSGVFASSDFRNPNVYHQGSPRDADYKVWPSPDDLLFTGSLHLQYDAKRGGFPLNLDDCVSPSVQAQEGWWLTSVWYYQDLKLAKLYIGETPFLSLHCQQVGGPERKVSAQSLGLVTPSRLAREKGVLIITARPCNFFHINSIEDKTLTYFVRDGNFGKPSEPDSFSPDQLGLGVHLYKVRPPRRSLWSV